MTRIILPLQVFRLILFGVAYLSIGGLAWSVIAPTGVTEPESTFQLLWMEILLTAVAVPLVWLALHMRHEKFSDIGFGPVPKPIALVGSGIALGFIVKLATIPVGILAYLLGLEGGMPEMDLDGTLGLLAGLGAGALAGVHEEIVFRGYVRVRLAEILRDPVPGGGLGRTGLVISLAFGLLHSYQGAMGVVVTTVVGLCFFAVATSPRYSLGHAIVAHAAFNAISFAFLAGVA